MCNFEGEPIAEMCKTAGADTLASMPEPRSEDSLANMIREDLGVTIEPQALRMFLRHRFHRVAPLAHRIHDGRR